MKSLITTLFLILAGYYTHLSAQPGALDTTFDSDGIVTTDLGGFEFMVGAKVQSDGKIIATGSTIIDDQLDIAIVRYFPDGTIDRNFGDNGFVIAGAGDKDEFIRSFALQPDGKILVAGSSADINSDILVARFTPDGAPDSTFGTGGFVLTSVGISDDNARAITVQPDGKIIIAGYSRFNGNDFVVIRYHQDGSLDSSFGLQGIVTTNLGINDYAYSIALQKDDKILVAGSTNDFQLDVLIMRYNQDGSIDSDFGTNGKFQIFSDTTSESQPSVIVQNDNKIVFAWHSFGGSGGGFSLARLNENGTLDNTFGTNGFVKTQIGFGSSVNALAVQPDGKIVAGGFSYPAVPYIDFAAARYNVNGSLDDSFGLGGVLTTNIYSFRNIVSSVEIQPDGKILLGGTAYGIDDDFALARYLSDMNVGVIDFAVQNNSIWVYPNPINDEATLEYTLIEPQEVTILLFDSQGKLVSMFLEKEKQSAGKQQQLISLPGELPAGTYFITLLTKHGKVSVQIAK